MLRRWLFLDISGPGWRGEIAKWESKNPSCALCAQIGVQIWHGRPNKTSLCVNKGADVDKVEGKVETRPPSLPHCLKAHYFSAPALGWQFWNGLNCWLHCVVLQCFPRSIFACQGSLGSLTTMWLPALKLSQKFVFKYVAVSVESAEHNNLDITTASALLKYKIYIFCKILILNSSYLKSLDLFPPGRISLDIEGF